MKHDSWSCVEMSVSVLCCRPNTGLSSFDEEKSDLLQKYRKISPEEAGELSLCFCLLSANKLAVTAISSSSQLLDHETLKSGWWFTLALRYYTRVPTNLENLELSGNFVNLEKSGKRQGICDMVRELFYEMSHFCTNLYKLCYQTVFV